MPQGAGEAVHSISATDDFSSIQRVAVKVRWVLIGIFLFILNFRPTLEPGTTLAVNAILAAAIVVNAWVQWRLAKGYPLTRGWGAAIALFELAAITLAIALTEAFRSSWVVLYYLVLLSFSAGFSRRVALAFTSIAALAYIGVSVLLPPGVNIAEQKEKLLVGRIAVMFAVTYAGSALIGGERRSRLRALEAQREAQRESNRLLEEVATTDFITGIGNVRRFWQEAERELAGATRRGSPLAVIILDVDDLKGVNDTYGHLAGDSVLRGVARILKASLRGADLACRYGGDEFALLLPDTDVGGARRVAERIQQRVEEWRLAVDEGQVIISVSMGVAAYPQGGASVDKLLQSADQAMYQARLGGGKIGVSQLMPEEGISLGS